MLEAIKIAEVKDKVQPVLPEEEPRHKLVAIRIQHNPLRAGIVRLWPITAGAATGYMLMIVRPPYSSYGCADKPAASGIGVPEYWSVERNLDRGR